MKLYYDADYKVLKPGDIIRTTDGFSGYADDEFKKHKFVLEHCSMLPLRIYDDQRYSPESSQTFTKCEDGSHLVAMENLFLDDIQHYTLYILDISEFRSEHLIPHGGGAETVTYYKVLVTELSRVLWVNLRSLHGSCSVVLDE
jgi:hypothetical protein